MIACPYDVYIETLLNWVNVWFPSFGLLLLLHADPLYDWPKQTKQPDIFPTGVKLEQGTDACGQQYNTPSNAILTNKSDLIIVGRGITTVQDPVAKAEAYRQAGYSAYMESIS